MPKVADMHHNIMMSLKQNNDVTCLLTCSCTIFFFTTGWYGVCEIEFSYIGKNSGNPSLVCKKR